MTETATPATSKEQEAEIDAICRDHGGALCKIEPRAPRGEGSVIVTVFPNGTHLDDNGEVEGLQSPQARYRVMLNGERLDAC